MIILINKKFIYLFYTSTDHYLHKCSQSIKKINLQCFHTFISRNFPLQRISQNIISCQVINNFLFSKYSARRVDTTACDFELLFFFIRPVG